MTLEVRATPEDVMRAVERLRDFGRDHGIPEKDLFGLALALEECGSNIVDHSLRRDAHQKFRVNLEIAGNVITIELRDPGPEFDPTSASPRKESVADDDQQGGWGLQLVRRYMDQIRYERENAENVLTLTKTLPSADFSKRPFVGKQNIT